MIDERCAGERVRVLRAPGPEVADLAQAQPLGLQERRHPAGRERAQLLLDQQQVDGLGVADVGLVIRRDLQVRQDAAGARGLRMREGLALERVAALEADVTDELHDALVGDPRPGGIGIRREAAHEIVGRAVGHVGRVGLPLLPVAHGAGRGLLEAGDPGARDIDDAVDELGLGRRDGRERLPVALRCRSRNCPPAPCPARCRSTRCPTISRRPRRHCRSPCRARAERRR